jgi:hypothetical protein
MTDWEIGYFIVNEDYLMNRILPQHVGAGFSRHARAKARTHMRKGDMWQGDSCLCVPSRAAMSRM